jgi:alpha-aminoadipate carrier protein LysW
MPSCPECENELDIEMDEVEEGDVVACDECGSEYEVVGVEPLELARVDAIYDEEDDDLLEKTRRKSEDEPHKFDCLGGSLPPWRPEWLAMGAEHGGLLPQAQAQNLGQRNVSGSRRGTPNSARSPAPPSSSRT